MAVIIVKALSAMATSCHDLLLTNIRFLSSDIKLEDAGKGNSNNESGTST